MRPVRDGEWSVWIGAPDLDRADLIASHVDVLEARRVLYAFGHQLRHVRNLEQGGDVIVDFWLDADGAVCEGVRWVIVRDGEPVEFIAYLRREADT